MLNGAKPLPSTPTSSVVTPWRTLGSWRPSARIARPPWLCRSMKPGATTLPVASIVRPTWAGAGSSGRRTANPAVDAPPPTPVDPGAPVPSDDRPAGDEQVDGLGHRSTMPMAHRALRVISRRGSCRRPAPRALRPSPDHVRMRPEDEPAGQASRVRSLERRRSGAVSDGRPRSGRPPCPSRASRSRRRAPAPRAPSSVPSRSQSSGSRTAPSVADHRPPAPSAA